MIPSLVKDLNATVAGVADVDVSIAINVDPSWSAEFAVFLSLSAVRLEVIAAAIKDLNAVILCV